MARNPTAIADKLLADGAITKSQHDGAIQHFQTYGGHIEESLLETKALSEEDLLKRLAQYYRTRFVTTAKLKKAEIGQPVISRVPGEFAFEHNVFPILLDKEKSVLSFVTSDPDDLDVEQEICRIANVSKVRGFVARPAAVKAAISKFYKGDIHAFANVDKEGIKEFQSMMDVYERNLLDEGTMAAAVVSSSDSRERTISEEEMTRDQGSRRDATGSFTVSEASSTLSLEVSRVLISLLESSRGELSGHSVLAASHVERMCARIKVSKHEGTAIALAALFHDLGKGDPYHLTAFNVAEWDGHKATAMKRYDIPTRLLESAKLPVETRKAIVHMYERYDGKGFPEGLHGTEIPLGARILAMADTFADLTSNPRNPYRRILTTSEAMEVLKKGRNAVFDGNMVDLFGAVMAGDDLKRQLLTGAQSIMVVDSDPEQSAILDMQLTTRGFKVRTVKSADEAIKALLQDPVNVVLSEVELKPFDGFELKNRLNDNPRTAGIPFFFFTARSESDDVERGFALGAKDYLVKPSKIDVVATKITKFIDREAPQESKGGVSGSLREMSIPDLVQILSHGRKTGCLKLSSGAHRGEIHFVEGDIYNALFDKHRGEEAFFNMLKFRDGSFALDPSFRAESRIINMTSEMLLLEGMRRMDEESR